MFQLFRDLMVKNITEIILKMAFHIKTSSVSISCLRILQINIRVLEIIQLILKTGVQINLYIFTKIIISNNIIYNKVYYQLIV